MYEILSFVTLLLIAPSLLGVLMCRGLKGILFENYAYRFVAGLMTELAVWAVLATPYMILFPNKPFHYLRYIYLVLLFALCCTSILLCKKMHININEAAIRVRKAIREYIGKGSQRIYVVIFLCILVFQLAETLYYAPVGYVNDDHHYFPEITASVYLDNLQFYGFKRILAPWYAFLAFIPAATHIHPLIICRTVMPTYILVIVYMGVYFFGKYCFKEDTSKVRIFMMWAAVIMEALSYTYYLFFMTTYISVYGKSMSGIIGVPVLLLTTLAMMSGHEENKNSIMQRIILLFAIGMGTAMYSFAGLIAGSAGMFLLLLIWLLSTKKKKMVFYAAIAEIPFIIQGIMYLYIR